MEAVYWFDCQRELKTMQVTWREKIKGNKPPRSARNNKNRHVASWMSTSTIAIHRNWSQTRKTIWRLQALKIEGTHQSVFIPYWLCGEHFYCLYANLLPHSLVFKTRCSVRPSCMRGSQFHGADMGDVLAGKLDKILDKWHAVWGK